MNKQYVWAAFEYHLSFLWSNRKHLKNYKKIYRVSYLLHCIYLKFRWKVMLVLSIIFAICRAKTTSKNCALLTFGHNCFSNFQLVLTWKKLFLGHFFHFSRRFRNILHVFLSFGLNIFTKEDVIWKTPCKNRIESNPMVNTCKTPQEYQSVSHVVTWWTDLWSETPIQQILDLKHQTELRDRQTEKKSSSCSF
jgi:hypothetical protein